MAAPPSPSKPGLINMVMGWWSGEAAADAGGALKGGEGGEEGLNTLAVHFENKGLVIAGTELKGLVRVTTSRVIPAGSTLLLEITGRERVQVEGDMELSRFILDSTFTAHTTKSALAPGVHTFPFAFAVSREMPASTHLVTGLHDVRLMYRLAGRMVGPEGEGDIDGLMAEARFVVAHRPQAPGRKFAEHNHQISSSRGIYVRAWIQQDVLTEGSSLRLKLKVNSTSVRGVSNIIVHLQQHVHLKFPWKEEDRNETTVLGEYPGFEPCFLGERFLEVPVPQVNGAYTTKAVMISVEYTIQLVFQPLSSKVSFSLSLPICIVPQHVRQRVTELNPLEIRQRPPWQPDQDAPKCSKCQRRFFSLFAVPRRHHCRHCGKVFCVWCCKRWTNVFNLAYHHPVRVCDDCFPVAVCGGTPYLTTLDGGDVEAAPPSPANGNMTPGSFCSHTHSLVSGEDDRLSQIGVDSSQPGRNMSVATQPGEGAPINE
eukprot:comp17876_c0_seq1/m.18091 comp17876_c0_seq1/g.18091  ORF comp17876_c0_seq1/g.18091 comp17876_c0_seq1/m.18091 type:complete len:484 (-) comp17876_c0_seq1:597-2048(-)